MVHALVSGEVRASNASQALIEVCMTVADDDNTLRAVTHAFGHYSYLFVTGEDDRFLTPRFWTEMCATRVRGVSSVSMMISCNSLW